MSRFIGIAPRTIYKRIISYGGNDEQELQTFPFEVARLYNVKPVDFFNSFYRVFLGQKHGPRFGTLARLIGKENLLKLLSFKLE